MFKIGDQVVIIIASNNSNTFEIIKVKGKVSKISEISEHPIKPIYRIVLDDSFAGRSYWRRMEDLLRIMTICAGVFWNV